MSATLDNDALRELERNSIRNFVESCDWVFSEHRVLDFGCGKQPYREIVEKAGGEYVGYDRVEFPANVSGEDIGPDLSPPGTKSASRHFVRLSFACDVILCTQVLQYVPHPLDVLLDFHDMLKEQHGWLVLTYATCWPIVEPEDLHRHTPKGIDRLLKVAGFDVERNEVRAEVEMGGVRFPLGGGALARTIQLPGR